MEGGAGSGSGSAVVMAIMHEYESTAVHLPFRSSVLSTRAVQ